jgi:hypothetical protein
MVDDLGTVYKIYCRDSSIRECYIGSTKDIKNRIAMHHRIIHDENNKQYDSKLYNFIRENGGFGNWIIEEMESFAFNDIKELREKEQEYINVLKPALNSGTAHKETRNKVYEYNEKYFKESVKGSRKMGKTLEWGDTGEIKISIPNSK